MDLVEEGRCATEPIADGAVAEYQRTLITERMRPTLYQLTARLAGLEVATPTGKPRWTVASVRGILRNPAYAGQALTNRTRPASASGRRSALQPAGSGLTHGPRPEQDWIAVPVPQVVSEETFAQVQAELDVNQRGAEHPA